MSALIEQSESLQTTWDVHGSWDGFKVSLQDYVRRDSINNGRYAKIIAHRSRQFVNAVEQLPDYQEQLHILRSQHRFEAPWHRYRIAGDPVMEAELITVFGECPTPIHSYDGPAGVVFVVDGELTLSRYAEISSAIGRCSAITNLSCRRVDRYALTEGTLIDARSTPVVEMQANSERCIFFNIHLRDHTDHPHYFYYPSYLPPRGQTSDEPRFFANRVPSQW